MLTYALMSGHGTTTIMERQMNNSLVTEIVEWNPAPVILGVVVTWMPTSDSVMIGFLAGMMSYLLLNLCFDQPKPALATN
jgi:hypothetical protein